MPIKDLHFEWILDHQFSLLKRGSSLCCGEQVDGNADLHGNRY